MAEPAPDLTGSLDVTKRAANGHAKGSGVDVFSDEVLSALAKGLVQWLGPELDAINKRLGELDGQPIGKQGDRTNWAKVIGESLADTQLACRREIAEATAPLIAEIAELKARPSMKYCGVWDAEKIYRVGDFVTADGSLFHCSNASVGVKPGSNPDKWKLAVKRGKDAAGAR